MGITQFNFYLFSEFIAFYNLTLLCYTDSQKRQINSLSHNAEYIVSIEDNKENIIDYNISGLTRDLSDIDLKNEDHFVVTITDNSTAYVVKKEFYELFNRKTDAFRAETTTPSK